MAYQHWLNNVTSTADLLLYIGHTTTHQRLPTVIELSSLIFVKIQEQFRYKFG